MEICHCKRNRKVFIIRGAEAATCAFCDLAGRRDDGPAAVVGAVAGALVIVCGNARLPCREGFPVPGAGAVRCRAGKVPCGDGKPFWWDGLLFWFYLFIY
uniref:Uncharacterized protein n=1 Tax=Candidatus Kentrum sp. DK TaxID=2126562 RepID=A0A450RUZ9_9GAMM|nr:MAG: hypothetical protein BECKDK2373B_GA0170837_100368 [Candidatus Kentron sp. DK]